VRRGMRWRRGTTTLRGTKAACDARGCWQVYAGGLRNTKNDYDFLLCLYIYILCVIFYFFGLGKLTVSLGVIPLASNQKCSSKFQHQHSRL
jgi:hypothetical protein